jgi:ABC-type sugar transport system permease subunit
VTRKRQLLGVLLVAPSLLLFVGVLVYPIVYSLAVSFFDLHVTTPWLPPEFVGFAHYRAVLGDPRVRAALARTLFLAVFGIGLGIPVSLLIANLLVRPFPLRGLVRALLIIPWVIPGAVQGLLWARIYDPNYGALNGLLYQLGLISAYVPWLLSPQRALLLVALASLWGTLPLMVLLYLAGLQGIPRDLYEAAALDGAGAWARFRYVTFPLLLPVTLILLILKTIDAFALFDLVYVLTGGGPNRATEVIGFFLYMAAFQRLDYGYASALAWLIALVTLGLAVLYRRLAIRGEGAGL